MDIPQGANIFNAYVQFQVDEIHSEATALTIEGEDIDDAATFTSSSGDISSRIRTPSNVAWSPEPWTTIGKAGPAQRTPDISQIIQEIVSRPGWSRGNSLALIVTGTGKRVAESYNGDQSGAPLLRVGYDVTCEGDYDADGYVDGYDLAVFAADFDRTDCSNDCEGDVDSDGDVDGSDLAAFAADFGRTDCPTSD